MANQRVERNLFLTDAQRVLHLGGAEAGGHFTDGTAAKLNQWIASDLNRILATGVDFELHSCGPM